MLHYSVFIFFLRQDLKYLAPVFLSKGLVESCRGNTHLWSIYSTSADEHYIHSFLKGVEAEDECDMESPYDKITCMEQVTQHQHGMFDVEEHCVLNHWRLTEVNYFIIYANLYFCSSLWPRDTAPLTILYNELVQFL